MKTISLTLMTLLLSLLTSTLLIAQVKGSGEVIKQNREVASFDAIEVGCAINLFVSQGDQQVVTVETDENLVDKINTKVSNGKLILSCDNIKNATKMNVYVTAKELVKLEANAASIVKGMTPIRSDHFALVATGASKVNLEVDAKTIFNEASGASKETLIIRADDVKSEISGASDVNISGTASSHKTEVSGAGKLQSLEFVTDQTDAEISGAGNASVMARKLLKAELSGAGNLVYFDNGTIKKIARQGEYQISFDGMDNVKSVIIEDEIEQESDAEKIDKEWVYNEEGDTVTVVINDKKIVVVTDDTVKIKLGDRDYVFSEDGVNIGKPNKKSKFDGHWDGFELSVNGMLDKDMAIKAPNGYDYLDLNYNKSIGVNINFFEQNVNLIRQHLGLVTGMGLTWNNYRFSDNVILTDNGQLGGYYDTTANRDYEKSKLMVCSLRVPLMLEFQTNNKSKVNSFHIAGGVVGSARLWSHTKIKVDGDKSKDKGDFYINPFRVDAIAKIGWGKINVYGTYALTEMFRKDKGPEVYPFEIGISLTDF